MPNQFGIALYLDSVGYDLYLMGSKGLLLVQPEFFRAGAIMDEGYGPFFSGNVLAVQREFSDPLIRAAIDLFRFKE
jgi:hypothetical protein